MMKLVAVVALALTLDGAFVLHAVVAAPRPAATPRAVVEMEEVRVPRQQAVASALRR